VYLATGRLGAAVYASSGDAVHFAAGLLLAAEAGAVVTDQSGQPFQLDSPILVAAASAPLHRELCQLAEWAYGQAIEDAESPRM
jgi:fructose-1,6-bisphosphatase/inositol monophosphatase family enzyme